nr:Imm1 family immunity protein [Nocardiopsis algeriensis]
MEKSDLWRTLIVKPRAEVRHRRKNGDRPDLIYSPKDVDALIDSMLENPITSYENFRVIENLAQVHSLDRDLIPSSGYPDHELLVGVNVDSRVGIVSFMDADGNFAPRGSAEGRSNVVYYAQGEPTEFPDNSEISIDLVRQAVKEFVFSGGERPSCIQWQVIDFW